MQYLFKSHNHQELPQRVQSSLKKHDIISQQIISIASMLLALVFAGIHMLNVRQRGVEGGIDANAIIFDPVPWALGAYVLFNCIRIIFALRDSTPGWFVVLDSVIDVALLMGMIWMLHLSYNQPPEFILKAPAILYVFIFIALRVFRLNAMYVLITGFSAAFGWSLLLVMVARQSQTDILTNSYIEYINSNTLLVRAELGKIIAIIATTTILAFAILRANKTLYNALRFESAQHELSRFFDKDLASQISTHGESFKAGYGKLIDASVLNIDIRGFTELSSKLSANEVMQLLSQYQAIIVPIIQKYHGNIDKFLGDGIMATFGAIQVDHHKNKHALLAIEEIFIAINQWNAARKENNQTLIDVNGAFTHGDLISGVVGSSNRLEYTAIGNTVNLAAKLEKHNKTLNSQAVCSLKSWESAQAEGYVGQLKARIIKNSKIEGVSMPVDLVCLEKLG